MNAKQISRIISVMLLLLMVKPVSASEYKTVEKKNFIYRVKINDISDKASFTNITNELQAIFDNTARFSEVTGEIIIHSDWNISKEKLSKQLERIGHSLKSYRQVFIPLN